eukprot:m.326529 g.326529  ORF g.326529 m.326529 type:complete len:428 (+) comp16558_c2_seq1:247-1530(+)
MGAEDKVRMLARKEENKRCAECGQRGPNYIDVTAWTFICTDCSGILRGLVPPHRCKGVSMATFKEEEVQELAAKGNAYNKEKYLARWDPDRDGDFPTKKNASEFRRFVERKYDGRWAAKDGVDSKPVEQVIGKKKTELVVEKPAQVAPPPTQTQTQAFGTFSGNYGAGSMLNPPPQTQGMPQFQVTQSAPPTTSASDDFGAFTSSNVCSTQAPQSGGDPFGANQTSQNTGGDDGWGAFSGAGATQAAAQEQQQQQQQQQQTQQDNTQGATGDLAGLSLGQPAPATNENETKGSGGLDLGSLFAQGPSQPLQQPMMQGQGGFQQPQQQQQGGFGGMQGQGGFQGQMQGMGGNQMMMGGGQMQGMPNQGMQGGDMFQQQQQQQPPPPEQNSLSDLDVFGSFKKTSPTPLAQPAQPSQPQQGGGGLNLLF